MWIQGWIIDVLKTEDYAVASPVKNSNEFLMGWRIEKERDVYEGYS